MGRNPCYSWIKGRNLQKLHKMLKKCCFVSQVDVIGKTVKNFGKDFFLNILLSIMNKLHHDFQGSFHFFFSWVKGRNLIKFAQKVLFLGSRWHHRVKMVKNIRKILSQIYLLSVTNNLYHVFEGVNSML